MEELTEQLESSAQEAAHLQKEVLAGQQTCEDLREARDDLEKLQAELAEAKEGTAAVQEALVAKSGECLRQRDEHVRTAGHI